MDQNQNTISDEKVANPTKTSAVSRTPEAPQPQLKTQPTVRPQQQVVRTTLPSGKRGRNAGIQES